MSATKISDLLPIPAGIRQPHPYQVFGLDDGEQDPAAIQKAIQSVIAQLKSVKSETDPDVWKQAARLVKGAQEILADPEKKSQLDARFGIVAVDTPVETDSSDPLAALLPTANPLAPAETSSSDPLAGILPTANPLDGVPSTEIETAPRLDASDSSGAGGLLPPGLFGTPTTTGTSIGAPELSDLETEGASDLASASVVVKTPPKRRRKRSLAATIAGVGFALLAFAVVGGVLYFAVFKSGQVEITMNDDGISFSTQPQPNSNSTVVTPAPPVNSGRAENQRGSTTGDPIMGSLGSSSSPATTQSPGSFSSESSNEGNPAETASAPASVDEPAQGDPPGSQEMQGSNPSEPAMAPAETMTSEMAEDGEATVDGESASNTEPNVEPAPEPLSDEMIAQADLALDRVRQLIQTANWSEMKAVAEAAQDQPMSAMQQQQAEDLYAVADLASYYRVGIERAIADLKIGNDFEVTDGVRVIIVEAGPDQLVVRYDAKNRAYSLNELPWSLAHKLGSFSMPENPSTEAAKAVYQAIAPNANQGYREQALQWLEEMEGEVEGADPRRLAETIRSLFPSDS